MAEPTVGELLAEIARLRVVAARDEWRRERQRQAVILSNARRAKAVRRCSDGAVFRSLREAATADGKTAPGIAWQARNTRRWEFVR